MNNLIIVPGNNDIEKILEKNIKGIIIGVKDLSIYDLTLDIDKIIAIAESTDKKVIIAINKMIHNKDLKQVKEALLKIKDTKVSGVLFYDLGILNMAKDLELDKELILSQEHLNASINSNKFYYDKGINSTFITSDITYNEVLAIKDNTKLNIYYTVYGYLPIFYSRRLLLTNYFKYINKDKTSDKYYIYNNEDKYLVKERNFGTIIYSPLVNLINHKDKLNNINLVIDLSYNNNIDIIDDFINNKKTDKEYLGFFNTKTTYKLRGDNNE